MKVSVKNTFRFFLLLFAIVALSIGAKQQVLAQDQKEDVFETFTDDYKEGGVKSDCSTCTLESSCNSEEGSAAPAWLKFGLLVLAVAGGAVYISKKFNWQIAALLLALVALGFIPKQKACSGEQCELQTTLLAQAEIPSQQKEEDEFRAFEEEPKTDDSFEEFSDSDEFKELSEDEFSDFSTEPEQVEKTEEGSSSIWENRNFTISLLVLFLTLVAGILVRFKTTRKLRLIMLLGTMVFLGFLNGACPCMISSFQNTVMYIMGIPVEPILMLWFLGLIPLTYLFGKVWCGWVCHLGALQEFIYRPKIFKGLQNQKSQSILKWIRIAAFIVLLTQIIITKTNIFIHYDPFKVAYNLFSANTLGYILVIILLVSSVLIYRPFCRAFCPVGLVLGWISYIPGSAKLAKDDSCVNCKSCSNACNYNAMTYENKKCDLNHEECIMCGDCMDSCKFSSIEITGIAKK